LITTRSSLQACQWMQAVSCWIHTAVLRLDRARRCIQTGSEGKEDAGRGRKRQILSKQKAESSRPSASSLQRPHAAEYKVAAPPEGPEKNPQLLHVLKEEEGHQRARSRRADTGTWSSKKATFRDATLLSVLSVSIPLYIYLSILLSLVMASL
jgi:hypothetical protein